MDKIRYEEKLAAFYKKLFDDAITETHIKAVEGGRNISRSDLAKKLGQACENCQDEDPKPEPEPVIESEMEEEKDEEHTE